MDTHVWVRNTVTGGTGRCPAAVLKEMAKQGWEPCDPPEPDDPTTADARAWRAANASASPAETKPKKAAARGETQQGSEER